MDKQTMHRKYATFYPVIQELGRYSPFETVPLEKVFKGNKSLMQKAYTEVRETEFDGKVTDYVCWFSTAYMVDKVKGRVPKEASIFDWVKVICDQYQHSSEKADIRNFIRLWRKYRCFYSLLRAEINGETYTKGDPEKEFKPLEGYDDQSKASAYLGAFRSMVRYEEAMGHWPPNANEFLSAIFKTLQEARLP